MPKDILKTLSIAVVGPLPPPAGGMANQAQQLVALLQSGGAQVNFVRVNSPYKPAFIENVKGVRALFRLIPYFWQLILQIRRSDLVHVLANSGWSWHLFAAPAVWVAWLLRKPVVLNYRGGEADAFFERSWRWVSPTVNRCRAVVVPSAFLQRVFARRMVPSSVVPNILDLQRFQFEDKKIFNDKAPHLVVTRNLEKIYGVDTVLNAFAMLKQQYPEARLTVAGSGPEEGALKEQVSKLGIEAEVTFTGRLDPEQIAQLYKDADLLLNASTVDNSPNSLIEALASGVPVVSSNVGGIPDLVCDGESALLVPPQQPEMLAEAVLRVFGNQGLRDQLVQQGKSVADRFDKHKVLEALAESYSRVVRR